MLMAAGVTCAAIVLIGACGNKPSTDACGAGERFEAGMCLKDLGVAVNGVGMLEKREKRAVFMSDGSADFQVIEVASGQAVYSGTAVGPQTARDTEQTVYLADFSDLKKPGHYYVQTNSGKKSSEFEIGSKALESALDAAMLGMYGQRCGVDIDYQYNGARYAHRECHLDEASLVDVGEAGTREDHGGWHDAGDYGKYVVNGAFAVAFLVAAYEHFPEYLRNREFAMPESGDATPDILDEARVELEWILKTQLDDGSFSHKVTARNFEPEVMPERDRQARFFYSPSTAATGDAVGALAQAARVFQEFDEEFAETCLRAAQKGQAFLDEHPMQMNSIQDPSGTGMYTSDDVTPRIWALAELWATTLEPGYLLDLENRIKSEAFDFEFDWSRPKNLGLAAYLRTTSDARNPEIVARLTATLASTAQNLYAGSQKDVYGRASESYYWGTNGIVCRTAFNLALANELFGHTDFLDAMSLQVGHMFGLNGFGRSYVTQVGPNPAISPHHRPSQADAAGDPWPGLLIGGPHDQGSEERGTSNVVAALDWQDKASNYFHNEIAINWNTALIYALVATLATKDGQTDSCWPDDCYTIPESPDGAGGAGGGGN